MNKNTKTVLFPFCLIFGCDEILINDLEFLCDCNERSLRKKFCDCRERIEKQLFKDFIRVHFRVLLRIEEYYKCVRNNNVISLHNIPIFSRIISAEMHPNSKLQNLKEAIEETEDLLKKVEEIRGGLIRDATDLFFDFLQDNDVFTLNQKAEFKLKLKMIYDAGMIRQKHLDEAHSVEMLSSAIGSALGCSDDMRMYNSTRSSKYEDFNLKMDVRHNVKLRQNEMMDHFHHVQQQIKILNPNHLKG